MSGKNKKNMQRRATAAAIAQQRKAAGEDNRGQSLVKGAIILTMATLIVKVIGAVFKIPLANIIGEDGLGYFNNAYSLYVPIYTLAASGFASALSRQIAENIALRRYRNVKKIHQVARRMFLTTGIVGTIIMVLAAFIFVKFVNPRSIYAILAMCPSVLFCCIQGSYRGYYEGTRNMYPTAISQVIEAIGKLVLGLGFALVIMMIGNGQINEAKELLGASVVSGSDAAGATFTVLGQTVANEGEAKLVCYMFAAAGAVLGITLGSMASCIYFVIRHKVKPDVITDKEIRISPKAESSNDILKAFIRIGLPIAMGTLVLNITQLIDSLTINSRLASLDLVKLNEYYKALCGTVTDSVTGAEKSLFDYSGMLSEVPNALWGSYGYALSLYNLVPYITQALGISALPAIAGAWATGNLDSVKSGINSVVRIVILLGVPAGLGIFALAGPILDLLYPGKAAAVIAEPMLMTLGIMVLFGTLVTPMNSMLQAVGKQTVPVKLMLIGCTIKIVLNYTLVGIQDINIKGAPIGSLCCYMFIVAASLYILCKRTTMKFNIMGTFVKPLIAGILCAAGARGAYELFSAVISGRLATVLAICIAVVIYAVCIILLRILTKDDVLMLPKGEKIAKILEKRNWIG